MNVQRYIGSMPIEHSELSSKTVVSDKVTIAVDAARKRMMYEPISGDKEKCEEA